MTTDVDPSLNRRKLRIALRQAREDASLTQREVADSVEWSLSKLIRVETGTVSVSVTDLRALMELYQITDPHMTAELVEAARGSKGPSWWSSFHDVLNPQYAQYLGAESAACTLRSYHPVVIPGHLQSHEYAKALLTPRLLDSQRLERVVELRMVRQERLFRREGRPAMSFILDEAALRREVGEKTVMQGQLDQLLGYGARSDVTMRVFPFTAGAHYSTLGSFVLLGFRDENRDLVYLEHLTGSMTVGEDFELRAHYEECFETITERSLGETESLDLIDRIKTELGSH